MTFPCLTCRSPVEVTYKSCPACGEAISDFLRQYGERPLAGSYRLLSRLGGGGMGEVYKAHHLFLDTLRVIKVMRPSLTADERLRARFVREAQMAQRIDSRHLARLYEFAPFADSAFFMVWEFIDGHNLGELLRHDARLAPRRAAAIVLQILGGLEDIHAAGVIHRDISPDNVMVRTDPCGGEVVKIIDLGIAKDRTDADLTQAGMFLGKLRYSSPEQIGVLGRVREVDHRADVYSAGAVLYELLTGRPPLEGSTPQELLDLHLNEPPRPFAGNGAGRAVLALQEAVLRALEKDPSQRWQGAHDFRRALEDVLPRLGKQPIPLAPDFATPRRRHARGMTSALGPTALVGPRQPPVRTRIGPLRVGLAALGMLFCLLGFMAGRARPQARWQAPARFSPYHPARPDFAVLKRSADAGFAPAQASLAAWYFAYGGHEQWPEAIGLYRQAAEQGYPPAQGELARRYRTGDGVAADIRQSIRWYEAECDNAEAVWYGSERYWACRSLGEIYADGEGGMRDRAAAVHWLTEAQRDAKQAGFGPVVEIEQRLAALR